MAGNLKIVSLNVNGLNTPEKRKQIVKIMRKQKGDIVILQETHFRKEAPPMHKLGTYSQWFYSNNSQQKTRGVAIAIRNTVDFKLQTTLSDQNGRYLIIKGLLYHSKCTIGSIYAPNIKQGKFFSQLTHKIAEFAEGATIMGGDLNIALNPSLDTSKGVSSSTPQTIKAVHKHLQTLRLIDSWRFLNPTSKEFTFYSYAQNGYSRIDYIFISQHYLHWLQQASIDNISWSDHATISATFQVPNRPKHEWNWRLNDNLLKDCECQAELQSTIKDYKENVLNDPSSHQSKWLALKCVIRGILIKHGARLKRERQNNLNRLLTEIQQLEAQHQVSLDKDILQTLTNKRLELKQYFNAQTTFDMIRLKQKYYEFGNKSGKLLARALKDRQTNQYIHKIKNAKGEIQVLPGKIALAFKNFYE
uniref:exodeoxyribonuclease III n=1 Tax=Xenopus tropicalis TaxID=8364 RepID=A0A803K2U2_XENTR